MKKILVLLACTIVSGLYAAAAADEFQPLTFNGKKLSLASLSSCMIEGVEEKGLYIPDSDDCYFSFDGLAVRSQNVKITDINLQEGVKTHKEILSKECGGFDTTETVGLSLQTTNKEVSLTEHTFVGGGIGFKSANKITLDKVVSCAESINLIAPKIALSAAIFMGGKPQDLFLRPFDPSNSPYKFLYIGFKASEVPHLVQGAVDFSASKTVPLADGDTPYLYSFGAQSWFLALNKPFLEQMKKDGEKDD